MRWLACFCSVVLTVTGSARLTASDAASPAWPQWRGPARSGVTAAQISSWPPRQAWTVDLVRSESSPIIAEGRVYCLVGGERATLVCLAADSGAERWRHSFGSERVTHGRHARGDTKRYRGPLSTPAVGGGTLVALGIDGDLVAVDSATGTPRWQLNLHDRFGVTQRQANRDFGCTSSPLITADRVIVGVGGTAGTVMAFALDDGRVLDAWGSGQWGHSSGPASTDGRVYLTLDHLVMGRHRQPWQTKFACNIPTPAVHDDLVVATSGYNIKRTRLFRNGSQVWESPIHSTTTSPVISGDQVYVGEHCLALSDGSQRWSFDADTFLICNAGARLLSEHRGTLYCYDTTDGSEIGRLEGAPAGSPSIAFGNQCILVKGGGRLACYRTD